MLLAALGIKEYNQNLFFLAATHYMHTTVLMPLAFGLVEISHNGRK
jgi:hypothetical protein